MNLLLESPSVFMTPVVLAVAAIILFYWYCISTFGYWKKKGVPYLKPTPFFGNLKEMMLLRKSQNEVYQELYNHFEGHRFAGIYQARKPTILLRDPELIKAALVKDFQHFHDRGILVHTEKYPLQRHLFNLSGRPWKNLRNKLSPTFTSARMKTMFHVVEECSHRLWEFLEKPTITGEPVDIKDLVAKYGIDVIGTCAFGLQMNALDNPDSDFRRMGKKVFESSAMKKIAQFSNMFLPEIGKIIKLDDFGLGVTDFFMNVVKETVDYRVKNNIIRNDFLQMLINLRYKGSVNNEPENVNNLVNGNAGHEKGDNTDVDMDDGLMAAQAFVFFIAAFETSASAASFSLLELALQPDLQTRLQEEIDSTLKECGGRMTYDALMNMKYMDKVICETLRKYPPAANLFRSVTVPYTIPGTNLLLEKDTAVTIPVYALQHDPRYFPDPQRYDPERFSEEQRAARHHYVYLPFGEGPRNCIGMRFGLLQSKMALAAVLSRCSVHPCALTELPPLRFDPAAFITATVTPTMLRVSARPTAAA